MTIHAPRTPSRDPTMPTERRSTSHVSPDRQLPSDAGRSTQAFPEHEALVDETGYRASMDLERVRREHGPDAVHAAAYALIVTAVGHFASECGVRTAQLVLQLMADDVGENCG